MIGRVNISRCLFILYLNYVFVIKYFFNNVYIEFGLLILALIIQISVDQFLIKGTMIRWLIVFAVFCGLSSVVVAVDFDLAMHQIIFFLEYSGVVYLIHRYSDEDGNVRFSALSFIIAAVNVAVTSLVANTGGKRLTFSENANTNMIGVICVFGIAFLLFYLINIKKTTISILVTVSLVLCMSFVIVRTVSKKSIICGTILILIWLIFCYKKAFAEKNIIARMCILILLCVIIYFAFTYFIEKQSDSFEFMLLRFQRMTSEEDGSTVERIGLIKQGIEVFFNHIVVGVGFNNFRYHNSYGAYAHNFYIELLSCCGVVGSFIFMMPIFRSLKGFVLTLHNNRKQISYKITAETQYMFAILIVLLAISNSLIIFYEVYLMYVLGVVTAYIEICSSYLSYDESRI